VPAASVGQLPRRCTIASDDHDLYAPSEETWAYADAWPEESETIREARERAAELGCTPVSRPTAALLRLLAATLGAQSVVEVGTGAGVSGAALLSGMAPAGVLTSIDIEAENQRVARETFTALGYDHTRTRLIAGRALDVLPRLSDAAYDIVLVDGDKSEYPAILTQAKRLLRVGGLAIFDNSLWSGRVADAGERDAETVALRDTAAVVQSDDDWLPALLTVGDGLLVASLRDRT
jgi:predicted O-methyltransferase YrrM